MGISNFFKRDKVVCALIVTCAFLNTFGQNSVTFDVDGAEMQVGHGIFALLMERLGRQWSGQGAIFVGTNSNIPNTNGLRNDVIEGFKDCGVGCMQWPGGCAANGYDWNSNKSASNDVGVDRFIEFCRLTGAEAFIVGKPTANDAASNEAFARYVLEDLDYPLKWFKVGNEIWGGCGTEYTNGYTTSHFPANYERLKELRSIENGKDLKIIAAANEIEGNYGWIPGYYSSIGDMMDGIEFHDYIYHPNDISSTNFTTQNYWQIMDQTLVGDVHAHLETIYSTMASADPDKRVKIVFDEWGNWLEDLGDGWMQQNTVMDAVGAGAHLNQFIQKADLVSVAALAQGVNVIQSVININTSGELVKTPTFYVFKMYKPHHANNAKFLSMSNVNFEKASGNIPIGNAAATLDDSGYVNISLVNNDLTSTREITVTLTGGEDEYTVTGAEVVTGPNVNSCNDFGKEEVVNIKVLDESNYTLEGKTLNVTMPTKSVVMVRLKSSITGIRHGRLLNKGAGAFSIAAGRNGSVVVNSPVTNKTPVKVSLHTINGRVMMNSFKSCLVSGRNSIGFNNKVINRGIYLVKITGDGINLAQKIIIAR